MIVNGDLLLYGVYGTVFLAVVLTVHGVAAFAHARRARKAARLRRMGAVGAAGSEAGAERLRRRSILSADLPGAKWVLARRYLAAVAAGLAVLSVAGLVAARVFGPPLPWTLLVLGLPLGLAGLVLSLLAYARVRKERRRLRFAAQLPDALEVMVRSLRAGHPVTSAMAMVRSDLPEPIAGEFGRALDEMTYGLELREALELMARRVDVPDLRFVVASINLQHETGGNLAELLQGLADLMRARVRVARKVRAHTAEARLSARFLAVMPLVFVGLVFTANPEVYAEAARDSLFWPIVLGAAALQVFGIAIMGRLARVRV